MWSILAGFIGSVVAWIATEFVAKPVARFRQLRSDVADVIALYEDQSWRFEEEEIEPPNEADWLQKRKEAYEATGSALVGFATSQRFITGLVLRICRCDVYAAGSWLRALGEVRPATPDAAEAWRTVRSELKL